MTITSLIIKFYGKQTMSVVEMVHEKHQNENNNQFILIECDTINQVYYFDSKLYSPSMAMRVNCPLKIFSIF